MYVSRISLTEMMEADQVILMQGESSSPASFSSQFVGKVNAILIYACRM